MVKIIYEKDKEIQQSENKTTITREIQFEADDIIEIATSNLLPQSRSRHPKLSAYYLESSRTVQVGNLNRRVQARATLSYVNSSSSVNYVSGVDPWDLGAQNVNFDFIESPTQLTIGTKKDGTYIQNLNSARCRILAETTESIAVLSFSFSVKAKASGEPQVNFNPIINKDTVKVAGIEIPEYMGKLLPLKTTYVVEYKEDGVSIKRRFWDYSAQIQIRALGWAKTELDVGTLCYFKNSDGVIVPKPRAIYCYTPWESSKLEDKLKVAPRYGSLDDVINAINKYHEADGVEETDNIPYEEITEPMPLRKDGTLYEEALEDPALYPYNTIEIFDCEIGSWNAYNLPKKRA